MTARYCHCLPTAALLLLMSTVAAAQQTASTQADTTARAGTQQAGGGAQPPAGLPPSPNPTAGLLPDRLQVRGEFRERIEGMRGAGFVAGRDDAYALSRVRLAATVRATTWLSLQTQVQDARVALKSVGPSGAPFHGPLDVRQAFAELGNAQAPVALRVGRQELFFGEQRLVGHLAWVNNARTWDAVRVTARRAAFTIDAFGASLVRSLDGEFDRSGNGNRFAGVYATTGHAVPRASLEPFVFWRRDINERSEAGVVGSLQETTAGGRLAGRLPARLDYSIEMAIQAGTLGPDAIAAWAGHWQLRESFPGPGGVRLAGEYNHASGDSDPSDGTRGTFDQLYPTGHDKLGLADQVGWRNIHHLRAGVEFTPMRKTPVTAAYHSWWLAERRDGLYAANGTLLARVAAGAASRHVGQEIDVQVSRTVAPQLQLAAGYAHMFSGAFLEQASPGANYSYPYVMATYAFQAGR